jgi:cell fate regulator YaaT (PSP1 superfamily)
MKGWKSSFQRRDAETPRKDKKKISASLHFNFSSIHSMRICFKKLFEKHYQPMKQTKETKRLQQNLYFFLLFRPFRVFRGQ